MGIFGFRVKVPVEKILVGCCWDSGHIFSGCHFCKGDDVSSNCFLSIFKIRIVIRSEFFVYVHFVHFSSDFFPDVKTRSFS